MLTVSFALENATLYDGVHDPAIPNALLLVRNGQIVFAGPSSAAPPFTAGQSVDGRGGVVLPGLIDLHVHALTTPSSLPSFAANGVTTLRDMAAPALQAVEWRRRERRNEEIGLPRIFASGPVLTCERGYPSSVWGPDVSACVTGRYQVQERVRKLLGMGLDVVKLGLEHELGPCLSLTEAAAAADAARALGKHTTAHLTNVQDFELALKAGLEEAAHIPARPIPDDLWKEAASKGMVILPTLHAHAGWADEWGRRIDHPFGCQCAKGFQEGHHQAMRNLERFLSFGGKVAYGTDAGNPRMPFGASVEEWLDLQRCGLTPAACLRMATSEAAEVLGEGGRLGRLEAGYAADFCFYRHDPLNNPHNLRTIEWTLKGGEWIPAGPLGRPKDFDLDYWIRQWELEGKHGRRRPIEG